MGNAGGFVCVSYTSSGERISDVSLVRWVALAIHESCRQRTTQPDNKPATIRRRNVVLGRNPRLVHTIRGPLIQEEYPR